MSMSDEIQRKLVAAFGPEQLEVFDESEMHRGHAGYQEGGESHFRVIIRAGAFAGLTRLKRHRAVHDALGPEVIGRIHALSLDIGD